MASQQICTEFELNYEIPERRFVGIQSALQGQGQDWFWNVMLYPVPDLQIVRTARIYKQEKNSGPLPLCLLIFVRSPISRRTRLSDRLERQKQILGLSEAETDQHCVMFI